jgi:NAD(P)H-dependent flavin oxidoreductase YrpB (nitropropane dioxygenase family)
VARHELAAAVSEAGGLGTIGGVRAPIAQEVAAARALTGAPIAVNLLLPFVKPGDAEAASAADVIVTFWGRPRRLAAGTWIHQCGSVPEAKEAAAAGADALIVQGIEAGGHVRGVHPTLELLERTRAAIPLPILAAGGIVERYDVETVLEAGATAAVLGTRFLLSVESHAHPEYKRRCLEARDTILTELFGLGWPRAPHRVVPNAATDRWLGGGSRCPRWITTAHVLLAPVARRLPESAQNQAAAMQRPSVPLLGPLPPTDDGPRGLVDSGPLYAGQGVRRIGDVKPAAALVADLTP